MSSSQATTSAPQRPYFPEIHDRGEIPIRALDTTNGHMPSFFYAPLDGSGKRMNQRAEVEAQQIESMSELLEDYGSAAAHFVRDNFAHVNFLYNGGPHIYRYHNTVEPWGYSYDASENGKVERRWTLRNTEPQRQEVGRKPPTESSIIPHSYDNAATPLRRVVVQEGFEYEAIANNPWRISQDLYDIKFDQTFLPNRHFYFSRQSELQLCWYSIKKERHSKKLNQNWPSGPLYGSEPSTAKMVGKVFSIVIKSPNIEKSLRDQEEWTCFIRTPSRFFEGEDFAKLLHKPLLETPLTLGVFTSIALRVVLQEWNELLSYMESLVAVHTAIVNPGEHDQLLFDDEEFSRSRRYFWMLSSLATSIHMMEESKLICRNFEEHLQELYPHTVERSEKEKEVLKAIEPHVTSLDQVIKRASTLQKRVMTFRDGLFNASAVLESRAANRLSENVKLLTYVSIFYLPLAFCASLWSTTETFSWTGLKIAMVLTAVTTYLVTFNLNQIVILSRSVYDTGKRRLVESMAKSKDDAWRKRADEFDQFQPPRSRLQPSEWLLLWYVFEASVITIWTSVSKVIRAVLPSSKTEHSTPAQSSTRGGGSNERQRAKDETAAQDVAAESLRSKTMGAQETNNTQATSPHATDGEVLANIRTSARASGQDKNDDCVHRSTASEASALASASNSAKQSPPASLEIRASRSTILLRRYSRKESDVEADAGAADLLEQDGDS